MKKICLNMIVKDESVVIRRCLNSVKNLIDTWVIVDTGSSDETQKIILECLQEIPGELYQRPWINFEWNRNEALNLARNKAEYTLFIDADDELVYLSDFSWPLLEMDSYYVTRTLQRDFIQIDSSWTLLIKNSLNWQWQGILHEEIFCKEAQNSGWIKGITNRFHGDGKRSQDPHKIEKDIEVLKQATQKEPKNSRVLFYLAEAYKATTKFHDAIRAYEKVLLIPTADPEETYWSLYWIAQLHSQLGAESAIIIASYFRCYYARPDRAEPLCDLANFYIRQNQYLLGYLLSEFALTIPLPNSPSCKKWIYDWAILIQYFTCCDHLGYKEKAKEAFEKLLTKENLPLQLRQELKKDQTQNFESRI